jgi:heat shock protein HslJ
MKTTLIGIGVLALLVIGFFALNSFIYNEKQAVTGATHKDAEYIIDGKRIQLQDGVAESEAAPGSASMIVTQYFGNEVVTDLNDDGREDVVFLLTQTTGGSGTFYYVVAALNTEDGYRGSAAVLLGDRIAPQTTEVSRNPSHKNVIVVNYADRLPGEDFSVRPSQGKSIWLKLDPDALQFGEVAQNFEGEADPSRMTLDMKPWVWVSTLLNDETVVTPKEPGSFVLTFAEDGTFSVQTDCNAMGGKYTVDESSIAFSEIVSTKMYCEGSQEGTFSEYLMNTSQYHFTARGQLILDLKFDSGTVEFI